MNVNLNHFLSQNHLWEKKGKNEEAICTWLRRWKSHFELYTMPYTMKIEYFGQELGDKAATWWRGLRTIGELPDT